MNNPYKILNLYACLGGNRYKWDEVAEKAGVKIEVTAVEWDEELASLYKERFQNDIVIVTDAHQYLLDHYREFDFIWSSPPCPSHSRVKFSQKNRENNKPYYSDMTLYQQIIFLDNFFDGKYCVENVIPYYKPLIQAQQRGRHLYWCNFKLPPKISSRDKKGGLIVRYGKDAIIKLCKFHDYDFFNYKGKQRRIKIARNLVDYEAGKTILATAMQIQMEINTNQLSLF